MVAQARNENEPTGSGSLRQSVLTGTAWTLCGFGLGQVLRLGSNIVLAALLYQEAFALMAIVIAVTQGLAMFSDIGLAPSVVQNRRGDDQEFLNTAWTIQVMRGLVIALIVCLLAWPVAAFYASNDPMAWELMWLLPLAAVGTIVSGFQSSQLMTAARHMRLARFTLVDLTAQLVAVGVMVGVAWVTRSVYALAIGSLAGACMHCLLSHTVLPRSGNRFRLEADSVREIVRFGKWIFVSTIITFLALQLDRLAFAKLFPLSEVGVYAIAASIAAVLPMLMGRLQSMVAFPLYSRILAREQGLSDVVSATKGPMLVLGGYLVALAMAGAHTFVDAVYDSRYALAGSYIVILAAGSWFAIIDGIYGAAFLASGRSRWVALVNATKVVSFCAILWPAIELAGFFGAVLAVAFSDALKLIVTVWLARSIALRDQKAEIFYTAYVAAASVSVYWLTVRSTLIPEVGNFVLLCIQFSLISLIFLPFLYAMAQKSLGRRMFARSRPV